MANVLLAAAGAALGGFIAPGAIGFLGLTGPGVGWLAGSLLASAFAPTQKSVGPRLDDLKVSGSAYGAVLPYIEGHPRLPCQVIAASDKREIANVERHGKGAGGSQVTTFTYEVDLLLCFTSVPCEALLKAFSGGDLVLNYTYGVDGETLVASIDAPQWDSLTFMGGDGAQLPHPDYEALVGAANAPAYRGRACIWVKAMKLGQSGQLQNITAEIARTATTLPDQGIVLERVSGVYNTFPAYLAGPAAYADLTEFKFGNASLAEGKSVYDDPADGAPTEARMVRQYIPMNGESGGSNWTIDGWIRLSDIPAFDNIPIFQLYNPDLTGAPYAPNFHYGLLIDSNSQIYPVLYNQVDGFWRGATSGTVSFPDIADSEFPAPSVFSAIYGGTNYLGSPLGLPYVTKHPDPIPIEQWVHVAMYRYENRIFTNVDGFEFEHKFLSAFGASIPKHCVGLSTLEGGLYYWQISVAAHNYAEQLFLDASSGDPKLALKIGGDGSDYPFQFDAVRWSDAAIFVLDSVPGAGYSDDPPVPDEYSVTIYPFNITPTYLATDPSVADVVERLCLEAGVPSDNFNVTDIDDIPTPVHAMTINQVTSARTVIEMLMASYFFDSVLRGDVEYFRKRAAAPVVTIPYADLGWSARGQSVADVFPINNGDDMPLPVQIALVYSDITSDHQSDTQLSDRISGAQDSVLVVQLPLGLTPAEAFNIANARLTDMYVALTTSKISLGMAYARIEPTDVVLITAEDGSTFRMRMLKLNDAASVLAFETVLDNATVFTQLGLTVGGVGEQTVVLPLPDSFEVLLDIPALRDADAGAPGIYDAIKGETAQWRSADLFDSIDAVTFNFNQTITAQAVFGLCTTTLGDYEGPAVFDEINSVTVNVGLGQLAGTTYDAIVLNPATNAAVVGVHGRWEVLQYRDAELLSEGVYHLSGLLRGRRGTEWAMVDHTAGERFVALGTSGMRFLPLQVSDLARERYYKIASAGQRLSVVGIDPITPLGVNLKPFAPVYLEINRDAADWVLGWIRRTRMSTRVGGPSPAIVPLGEATESYLVEIFDGVTVVRSVTVSAPTFTYTLAMRGDDFGSPLPTDLHYRVRMVSATVGPGYPADFEG